MTREKKRHDRGRMEVSLDLRDILRFVLFARRRTRPGRRASGGTPSIASRARASVGSSAASASGEAPSLLAASPRDRRAGLGRGNRATRLVSASLRFGIGRTCARMSTSLPLPSSPHWEPSTAHTWPSLFHSALLAFVVADGSATALQTVGRAARTARCGLCAFPENTAACARMGATAAMTLIVQTGRMSWGTCVPNLGRCETRAFDSPPAFLWRAPRRSRVLYPAAVCFDKPAPEPAKKSAFGLPLDRARRPWFLGLRGLLSHRLAAKTRHPSDWQTS